MAKARKHTTSIGSIALLSVLFVFAVTAGILYAGANYAARNDPTAFIERAYLNAEMTFKAAIDPRFQTTADEVGRVVTRLAVIDIIKGGALFDETGHLLQIFGEPTETSFETIEHTQARIFATNDPRRTEFYFSPALTGTPFHLLARVDLGVIGGLEAMAHDRILALSGVAGIGAGIGAALLVWLFVSRPIRKIVKAIDKALDNPALADVAEPLHAASTEIGLLVAGVERFRSQLADLWRTKVMVADAILEAAPFAVIQSSADGTLIFANPAANTFFGRDVVRTHSASPVILRDVATGSRAMLREHFDVNGFGGRLIEVMTPQGPVYAIAGGLVVGADSRAPTGVTLLADVTETQRARLAAEASFSAESGRARTLVRRECELKLMLETCLSLLPNGEKAVEAHLDVTPFALDWVAMARSAGLLGGCELMPEGPTVAGGEADLKAVVRLAMLLAYAKTAAAPVDYEIEYKGINFETAGFTIRARAADDASTEGPFGTDWTIALAALRIAIRRVNGQLAEFGTDDDGTVIRIVLRGASERVKTNMKNTG